jgi:hypothetical protein
MPYSPSKVDRCFGGTRRLRLHSRKISQARNQHEANSKQSSALTLKMEATCHSEKSVNFNGIHGVISQKIDLFKGHLEHDVVLNNI